eukprot:1355757-Rhodomonas_salina.1
MSSTDVGYAATRVADRRRDQGVTSPICLRVCYTMPGDDGACAHRPRRLPYLPMRMLLPVRTSRMVLCDLRYLLMRMGLPPYASLLMSGAEIAHAAISLRD